MRHKLKVDGVYDSHTLKILKDHGVSFISFDCRPRSFNFTQSYKIQEILDIEGEGLEKVFLKFEDEKDFIVEKLLNDIEHSTKGSTLILEFSGSQKIDFYDSFKQPFIWHFSNMANCAEILKSKHLEGIVLPFDILVREQEKGTLNNFYRDILKLINQRKDISLGLDLDWDSDVFPSLFDIFEFNFVGLQVNQKVEVCYRNIDTAKFKKGIFYFSEISL